MKPNKHLLLVLKLLVSGGLLTLLYWQTPLVEIGAVFRECNWILLGVIFAILLVNTTLSALKWRILLLSDAIDVSLRKLVVSYLIGGFFNIFLPSNIGGDSYRIVDVMKKSREGARSAASVLADRLTGFIALVSLSLVSSVFVSLRLDRPGLILLPLVALSLLLLILFMLWQRTWVRSLLRLTRLDRFAPVVRITEKFFIAFARYGADWQVVVQVMIISLLFQLLLILAVYLMALALHAPVSWLYFVAFVPLITLMEAVPVSIYGIGIRDMGYVFFFGMAGMNDIQTRSLALLFLAVTFVYSLIGGLLYLGRVYSAWKAAGKGGA
ncbi:MAG: lysylphosphatidylglycerol synthase transmembrane domain-containing protein [Desulfobulbus sp.]|jgi:uncharacterized protein (TIRG00374 family)|nr:lysylphosphatidylglycerol synthase transmembrane domain-containing protein [Desulfobulbus sp.]